MAAIPSITNTRANDPPTRAVQRGAAAAAPTETASVGLAPTLLGLTFAQLLLTGSLTGTTTPAAPARPQSPAEPPSTSTPRGRVAPRAGSAAPGAPAPAPTTASAPAAQTPSTSGDASEQLAQDVLDGVAALGSGDLGAFAGSLMRTARDTVVAALQLTKQAISYGSTVASIGASLDSS